MRNTANGYRPQRPNAATVRLDRRRLNTCSTLGLALLASWILAHTRNPIRIARVLRFGRRLLGDLHRSMLENMGSYKDYPPQ
jgi:hypothetical protein